MKKRFSLIHALMLSLLLHFVVTSYMYWLPSLVTPIPEPQTVDWLTSEELAKLMQNQDEKGQIVEQSEKSVNEDEPEDAKFLSQKNQKVVRETRAQNNGQFKNAGLGGAANPKVEQPKDNPEPENSDEKMLPSLADLIPEFRPKPQAPTEETGGDGSQASATDDHLKDVPTGAETILNTREFIYYSYYNRIKAKLRQYWEPKIKEKVERMFRQGRQMASTGGERVTKIIIVLNSGGTLIKVQVLGPSGVQDLDEAAIEAFEAAAPFPNPPKGIVDSDGTIKIRWDFILEASAGSSFESERVAWER